MLNEEQGMTSVKPQSFTGALLSMPHETFKEKLIFTQYGIGILFFSLLHPIALIISFIVVLFFTQFFVQNVEDLVFGWFFLLVISSPIYIYFLKRDYSYWIKFTSLPLRKFLNTVFLSQLVYVLFYYLCYYAVFVLPDELFDTAGLASGFLIVPLAGGSIILGFIFSMALSRLFFSILTKRRAASSLRS